MRIFSVFLAQFVLFFALAGCGGGGGSTGGSVDTSSFGTVSGTVTSSSVPVSGVLVSDSTGSYVTTTDASGSYSLSLPPGSHTLLFIKAGYTNTTGSVTITTAATTAYSKAITTSSATLTSITISPSAFAVGIGNSQQIVATGHYSDSSTSNVSPLVTWTTSSASIATVSSGGFVTGASAGTATITAKYNNTTVGTTTVTVTTAAARDNSFGTSGNATFNATSYDNENISTVKIVQTNKTLGLGTSGIGDYILAQVTDSGALDSSFGTGGYVTSANTGLPLTDAQSMDILPDGKIIFAGKSGSYLGLIRLTSTGVADTSFGANGLVTTTIPSIAANKVIYDAVNAKIYVVSDASIVRLTSSGVLDTTYGTNGVATITSASVSGTSAVLLSSGKLLITGLYNSAYMGVSRYTSTGILDSTFGTNGTAVVNTSTSRASYPKSSDIALAPDGTIYITGKATPSDEYYRAIVASFTSSGAINTVFSSTGYVSINYAAGYNNTGKCIAVQPDGKIIVAGDSPRIVSVYGYVARLNTDGTLDTSFGTNGIISNIYSSFDAAVIRNDGKMMLGGFYDAMSHQLLFARFNL